MKLSFLLRSAILAAVASAPCAAQVMPQDYWYLERTWGSLGTGQGQFSYSDTGIAVGTDDLVYAMDDTRIQVFQQNGQFVRSWPVTGPCAISAGPDGNLYVLRTSSIIVYTPQGSVVRQWNVAGVESNSQIAVAENGRVFVSDDSDGQISSFASDGTPLNKIGSRGSAPGQLINLKGLAVAPDGLIYVRTLDNMSIFKQSGEFVRRYTHYNGPSSLAITVDNLMVKGETVLRTDGSGVRQFFGDALPTDFDKVAVTKAGKVIGFGDTKISVYARSYRAISPNALPQPIVSQVQQRPASPILDIDFKITDTDSATVEAYPLGFVDGIKDFAHVLRITSLVEDTDSKRGAAVPTGVTNRLSWNAAADWSTQFGELQVEILANDGRGMLPFEFLTIPAAGGNPELRISRGSYTNSDFLHLWFWLLAKADPGITLTNGVVKGVGGAYDGQALTSGTATTEAGRAFLFQRMQVRDATAAEVNRAANGISNTINRWNPRIRVGPSSSGGTAPPTAYPIAVNEYGFDTGPVSTAGNPNAGNYWAVPLN